VSGRLVLVFLTMLLCAVLAVVPILAEVLRLPRIVAVGVPPLPPPSDPCCCRAGPRRGHAPAWRTLRAGRGWSRCRVRTTLRPGRCREIPPHGPAPLPRRGKRLPDWVRRCPFRLHSLFARSASGATRTYALRGGKAHARKQYRRRDQEFTLHSLHHQNLLLDCSFASQISRTQIDAVSRGTVRYRAMERGCNRSLTSRATMRLQTTRLGTCALEPRPGTEELDHQWWRCQRWWTTRRP
jgi:hypothetical protein